MQNLSNQWWLKPKSSHVTFTVFPPDSLLLAYCILYDIDTIGQRTLDPNVVSFRFYLLYQSSFLLPTQINYYYYNPLGNLNSGRSPWAKLIRSASLQLVFDAAISKLFWRLVSRCFYMSICIFFYHKVEVTRTIRMRCNMTKRFSTVAR